ncbi:MAG: accessory gene regulator B family protein [Clostridia bacterium]|nr:accessory gene regulator B family protein [Clostridia bacterium]
MIDRICLFLVNKIKNKMPDVDEERAEVILYGLQLLIGELPKTLIVLGVGYLLGIFKLTVLTIIMMMPYRAFSGGFHLHTHIGCIIATTVNYCGIALLGKYIILERTAIYILAISTWIFGMIMIKLYAPADTENVPILREAERKQKRILSYITLTIGLAVAMMIKIPSISTILIFGNLIQSLSITKPAYRLAKCKYGYEVYTDTSIA